MEIRVTQGSQGSVDECYDNQVLFAGHVLQKELDKDDEGIDACIVFVDYFGSAPPLKSRGSHIPVQDLSV